MGQKVHPYGFRLGVIRDWQSTWFAQDRQYTEQLLEDVRMRRFIKSRLLNGAISRMQIERPANSVTVTIYTAKPGVVIGRGGRGVDQLRADLEKMCRKKVQVNVEEVRRPELDAQLVAENIASQIERRISFRRAIRQAISRSMRMGAEGMRVTCSGRLGGAEIAHSETYRSPEGRVPLHTLRADVDYGLAEARTTYGYIGVKVWLYKGEILPKPKEKPEEEPTIMTSAGPQPAAEAETAAEEAPAAEDAAEAPAPEPSAEETPVEAAAEEAAPAAAEPAEETQAAAAEEPPPAGEEASEEEPAEAVAEEAAEESAETEAAPAEGGSTSDADAETGEVQEAAPGTDEGEASARE